jgi:hypothetical protein
MADVPTFEIFLGPPGEDAIWLESVEGLANAKERMYQLAAEKAGQLFHFLHSNAIHCHASDHIGERHIVRE